MSPASAMARTVPANRTGRRRLSIQYSGPSSPPSTGAASTLETIAVTTGRGASGSSADSRSSRSRSMPGECEATSTFTSRQNTSRARNRSASSASSACGPATTVDTGEFSTATQTALPYPAIAASASSADNSTASMAPWPASRRIRRLRRQITAQASRRLSAPATRAAAVSPMLCPTQTSGRTPASPSAAASETSIAHSAGCTWSIAVGNSLASVSNSSTDQPSSSRMAASQAVISARNAAERASSPRPMPSHCEPCPGKTNAFRFTPPKPASAWPPSAVASPRASARSFRARSSCVVPVTHIRYGWASRRSAAAAHRSRSGTSRPRPPGSRWAA